jgi:sn-glycerol 3-phosphate transport system permease protein
MAKESVSPAPIAATGPYSDRAFHMPKARMGGLMSKEWFLFLLFIFPNFLFLAVFTYWPLFENFRLSLFTSNQFLGTTQYSGFANYEWLFNNRDFRQVTMNTFIFIIASVAGTLGFGLAIALLLNEKLKGRTAVRALVFAPFLVSGAAIGLVWAYIFNPRYGLLAEILGFVGIPSPNWLDSSRWALPAIIIVYVWKNLGFATVVFLAGLQGIPKDLYEAAKLDGASAWWRFRSVTLPMLSPISFFLMVTSVLSTFQAFDIQDIMTGGGPAGATTTLVYYVFEQAFQAQNHERAAAAAVLLFLLMLVVTIGQTFWERRQVHYGG